MNWITEKIAIGNYLEAQDVELLRRENIQSVLSLDGTLENQVAAALGLKEFRVVKLQDAPGNDPRLFRLAVDQVDELVRESPPVLVQCHAGRSRSIVVVAGHLIKSLKIDAAEALRRVTEKREAAVTTGLERLLNHL